MVDSASGGVAEPAPHEIGPFAPVARGWHDRGLSPPFAPELHRHDRPVSAQEQPQTAPVAPVAPAAPCGSAFSRPRLLRSLWRPLNPLRWSKPAAPQCGARTVALAVAQPP